MRTAVLLLFLAVVPQIAQAEVITVDVTVKAIDVKGRSITVAKISKAPTKDLELDISKKAEILVDGKAASLDAVKPGLRISISYETGLEIVTKIEVSSGNPADGLDADGFVPLFDGKTLNGWRSYAGGPIKAGWVVENGMLCLKGKGGDIITERQYGDFELEFEWKVARDSNSGVLYRVQPGDDRASVSGAEYQVIDNRSFRVRNEPFLRAGAMQGLVGVESHALKPVGQFNQSRILVQDNHIEHWLNGERIVDITVGSPEWHRLIPSKRADKWHQFSQKARGHIALQDYLDESIGVCFRSIRIASKAVFCLRLNKQ
ncbi:MAG TPA: DUF1080 domain-containing protein [Planctomicrobium sp.]|nr:DUF1080 domain-containing protein [Planctomicrobium sp.]